ncbi:MAG: NHL repeat-containing protein [Spirochaetota bacterium]|nr:NHL repeat-containing protein [Spirochaetota bacterium]
MKSIIAVLILLGGYFFLPASEEINTSKSVTIIEKDEGGGNLSDEDKTNSSISIRDNQEEEEVRKPITKGKSIPPKCVYIIHEDEDGKRLTFPSSVFFETVKNEIYLIDSGNSRILIYTFDFFHLYTIDKDDGIFAPTCMTVDPDGYLFVGQSRDSTNSRARISVFNPCLKWERNIYFGGFIGAEKFVPKNIALDDEGNIYLAGTNHLGIVVLDKGGAYQNTFMPERIAICDVEIDEKGNIYLLSEEWGKVYIYDKSGGLVVEFGEKGGGSGKLSRPRGFSVDASRGRVYVIDYMRHTANVYDTNGSYLFEFGGKGWGKGWFQFPSDICIDRKGHVLIADTFNNRVQVLEIK